MSDGERVAIPIGEKSAGGGWRLVIGVLLVGAIGVAFSGGLLLGREEARSVKVVFAALERERDALAQRVADLEQEVIVFERTRQIDLEANRTAQEELVKAQDERLGLEKEVSFFRRLVQTGGGGILRVQNFKLTQSDEPRELSYSFTVSQIIQDFGESEGTIELRVAGNLNGKETTLPLTELAGSTPAKHAMNFQHFQNVEGRIVLPEDLEPQNLVIEIKPKTTDLLALTESFAWSVSD